MLSEVKERLEGPKYNIDFGGRGGGRQGMAIGKSTIQKGPFYGSVSTLCPSLSELSECKIVLLHTS